ncbi:YoaK family protein [Cytophagaceae bacterium ABcell3]|nr:YoaK family protein [Cytophagaceae bacterium ABcell3]
MYRKIGKYRTFNDNIRLASYLSTTAGIVNVASIMAFYVLTTNVTGHMAILSEEIAKNHWHQVFILAVWLFMFIFGSFVSTFFSLVIGKKNPKPYNYATILFEAILLFGIGIYGMYFYQERLIEAEWLSAILLFSMGLQNALVTHISNAVVRTTHLTGLFTDLGIELAALFNADTDKKVLQKKLKLRFTILFFYFIGGVLGGYAFLHYGFKVFYLAAGILLFSLGYDNLKYIVLKIKRKLLKKALGAKRYEKVRESFAFSGSDADRNILNSK